MLSLLSAALLAAAPPASQPDEPGKRSVETGSRLAKRVDSTDRDQLEVRKIQTQYGNCVVKKQYEAARNFVLTPNLEGRDWTRAVQKVSDAYCLVAASSSYGSKMTFPSDTMRYTLGEALVRREFPSGSPPSLKDAGPILQPVFDASKFVPEPGKKTKQKELDELAERRLEQQGKVYLAQFGECVVRAETGNSYALLMAEPGSAQEISAFNSLKPALSECLIAGHTLSFSKASLRGTIAMNFYRLAHAPRAAAATQEAAK